MRKRVVTEMDGLRTFEQNQNIDLRHENAELRLALRDSQDSLVFKILSLKHFFCCF